MSEPTSGETTDSELLAELADDFTARFRRGEHPTIEEYAQKYCGLAGPIRELFPALLVLEDTGIEANANVAPPSEQIGAIVGRYKLLERIGEGGFGSVFMAEQLSPVRRKVALKLIKPGVDTKQVISRFEAERQALAMMDHPNIAKVFDAGATEFGRPFFVMELVHGVPISDYCDQNRLSPKQRLELFVMVCAAVQHAHTKGIIHRDIKPTNVLVTLHDGVPVPKVIDFGVAKATGQQALTEQTLFTSFAQLVGTPLYMSPEQAEMSGLDVDTRSDIYSLGVLLYELITGTTPFDKERLRKAAYDEVRRIIREEEPPRPSTRISRLGDKSSVVSASCRTEAKRLRNLVRGELDWIVMRAMEKNRTRRYETADGLAMDVRRYLADEPVQACPQSAWYRFCKFARRRKRQLATAAAFAVLIVLAVAVGAILLWRETQRTQRANERLRENLQLAMKTLEEMYLKVSSDRLLRDPSRQQEDEELLVKALAFYDEFARQNEAIPWVRREVARAYRQVAMIRSTLGQYTASRNAWARALAISEQLVAESAIADDRMDLGYAHHQLGNLLIAEGEPPLALEHYAAAIALYGHVLEEHPGEPSYLAKLGELQKSMGYVLLNQRNLTAADEHLRRSVELLSDAATRSDEPGYKRGLVVALSTWGSTLRDNREYEAAADKFLLAIKIGTSLAEQYPTTENRSALAYSHLLVSDVLKNDSAEAIEHVHRAIDLYDGITRERPTSPEVRRYLINGYRNLATLCSDAGDTAAAEAHFKLAIERETVLVEQFPTIHQDQIRLANDCFDLGVLLHAQGDGAGAAEYFRQTMAVFEHYSAQFPDLQQDSIAWFLATCPDPQFLDAPRAVALAEQQVERSPEAADFRNTLGVAYYRAGNFAAAVRVLQEAIEFTHGGDSCDWFFLAMAQWKLGQEHEARESYAHALQRPSEQYPRLAVEYRRFRTEAAQLLGVKTPTSGPTELRP